MLSQDAISFARELSAAIGRHRTGVTLDRLQIAQIWGERDPALLRRNMEELDRMGYIRLESRIWDPPPEVDGIDTFGPIVGFTILKHYGSS